MSVEVLIMDEIGGYFLQCHGGTIQTVDFVFETTLFIVRTITLVKYSLRIGEREKREGEPLKRAARLFFSDFFCDYE